MKTLLLSSVALIALAGMIWGFFLTRDGKLQTPSGTGTVDVAGSTYEAFPLPDYAAAFIDEDYKSYFVEVEPGIKIHILEVGTGYPVYMQHGLPASGFLNRQVADALPRDQFRIIMPTMVGLGFSSKTPASDITFENQVRWMNAALTALDLEDVIFVGHDWGGPIGMAALARSPELAKGAVILNTVLDAPHKPRKVSGPLRIVLTPIVGEFFLEGFSSAFSFMPGLQADPASMPDNVIDLYQRPVMESGNSKGPLAIARMAVTHPDHPDFQQFLDIETYTNAWDHPTEIVWGTKDPILGEKVDDMRAVFPKAEVFEIPFGHFLQEEAPADVAASIQRVLSKIQAPE